MQFNSEEIAAIIGTKELERIWQEKQTALANARVAELEAKYEPKEAAKPVLQAVDAS